MRFRWFLGLLPDWKNAILAVVAAILLILAFPPFELWFTAWFALVPLLWAIEREHCVRRSFVLGWLFGNIFFFATCWWLTFAPITYAGFPAPLAYFLLFIVTSIVAVFPGVFAAVTAFLLNRLGYIGFLAVPFIWILTEFLRYWITGNNWNAIGYSQAFTEMPLRIAGFGGVALTGVLPVAVASIFALWLKRMNRYLVFAAACLVFIICTNVGLYLLWAFNADVGTLGSDTLTEKSPTAKIVALQPDVPMSGLTLDKWRELRRRHVTLAEAALDKLRSDPPKNTDLPITVIFPESPMNFMYDDDPETREFINRFTAVHNVNVLFNSAEPDGKNGKYFNSAVLVGREGREIAQYDKIYLLPFGEAVPGPLQSIVPAFVGTFSYGNEYDLLPFGDAKAGVMICFESHFGQLSRQYVREGADALIEMTNDGYLGPTPVLRQHLANAVFRAVETDRPVLRVTNVGITAYINGSGEVLDAAEPYTEATRNWTVAKSDGSQTFYVKYGDWFAWLCSAVTLAFLAFAFFNKRQREATEVLLSGESKR